MDDSSFERQLADALEAMTTPLAPDHLRQTVVPIVRAQLRPSGRRSSWLPAFAAVAVVIALAFAGSNRLSDPKQGETSSREPAVPAAAAGTKASTLAAWATLPRAGAFANFRLVTPEHGWIQTDIDLRYTADGGRTWQLKSLPRAASKINRLTFIDEQHVAAAFLDSDGLHVAVTSDGASTWRTSTAIAAPKQGAFVTLTFANPDHGWLFVGPVYPASTGNVYESTDGGLTWLGPSPVDTHEGKYSIRRYIGGGLGQQALVWRNGKADNAPFDDSFGVSATGGATWTTGSLPTPQGIASGLLKMDQGTYVTSSGRILMLLTFDKGRSNATGVFGTDNGQDWTSQSPLWNDAPGNLEGFFASDRDWLVASDQGNRSFVTANGGADWQTIDGTLAQTQFDFMTFATTSDGWAQKRCDAVVPRSSGPDCAQPDAINLYATHDSGKTWSLILSDAAGPNRNPSLTPSATFKSAEGTSLAKGSIWHLRFDYPADWLLKATDFDAESMYGRSLRGLGSVGNAPVTETCDWAKPSPDYHGKVNQVCSTTWDPKATVQVRFERDGRENAWDMWSGVMKPAPAGYDLTTIGGLPGLVASTNTDVVPGSKEVIRGADKIIVWAGASRQGWSYLVTAVLRGQNLDGAEQQVRNLIKSLKLDPEVQRLETDAASAQAALTAGLEAVKAQAARSDGAMSADCFSDQPGAATRATISAPVFLGYRLTQPLGVTCTTSIEPTNFQVWKMTLRYDWESTAGHPAGTASLVLLLSDGGGFGGDGFGINQMPGLIWEPGTP